MTIQLIYFYFLFANGFSRHFFSFLIYCNWRIQFIFDLGLSAAGLAHVCYLVKILGKL